MILISIVNGCYFSNVSNLMLGRIKGTKYVSNKEKHNGYF